MHFGEINDIESVLTIYYVLFHDYLLLIRKRRTVSYRFIHVDYILLLYLDNITLQLNIYM
jgi:hypothetical protein